MLSYSDLLERAQGESNRLQDAANDLKTELDQMTAHYLRTGWHHGFDDYYSQRREVYTQLAITERNLEKSQGREAILRGKIAAGEVRQPGPVMELAGAAA